MQKPMHFLITQRHTQNSQGEWIDSLENTYTKFFESLDVAIIPVSNATSLGHETELFGAAGIILTGGGDVDPELYGGKANPALAISKQRDAIEARLLSLAVERKLPILGICRGMQFINVFFGGKLVQNISELEGSEQHPCPSVHEVRILDSPLSACLQSGTQFSTNSYHRQGVSPSGLGHGLAPFAEVAVPMLIEGIYHRNLPIAGVQWHPERPRSAATLDRVLLTAFIERRLFWEVRH